MSDRKIVIHSGSHKTGTSAIQNYLYDHRTKGEFDYLSRNNANSSLWMLQAFKRDLASLPAFRHQQLEAGRLAEIRERALGHLDERIRAGTLPVAILSAEAISTFALGELKDLYDFLAPHYNEVVIHQYFRPLKSRMESAFQEKLKHRYASLEERVQLGYRGNVELLDRVFGRDNVFVHRYAQADFPEGDVVQHFLAATGIEFHPYSASHANTSLSLGAVQLLYIYRKVNPSLQAGDRVLVQRLGELAGQPFRLHSKLYSSLLGISKEAIAEFEARAGFSVSENITVDDDLGIVSEEDLLSVDQETLDWLEQRVPGLAGSGNPSSGDLASIAAAVGKLIG